MQETSHSISPATSVPVYCIRQVAAMYQRALHVNLMRSAINSRPVVLMDHSAVGLNSSHPAMVCGVLQWWTCSRVQIFARNSKKLMNCISHEQGCKWKIVTTGTPSPSLTLSCFPPISLPSPVATQNLRLLYPFPSPSPSFPSPFPSSPFRVNKYYNKRFDSKLTRKLL